MAEIRKMREDDRDIIIDMMRGFYASPCVYTNGSEEIFKADFDACVSNSPYLEGYVFEKDGAIIGYGMLAKSFSTEFGKPCMWLEDLYVKEEFRGNGIGKSFLDFITRKYTDCVFRLDVEKENERAVNLYKKIGFTILPYVELKK